jgi:hypothetical protein
MAMLDGLRTVDTGFELHLEGTDAAALGLSRCLTPPVRILRRCRRVCGQGVQRALCRDTLEGAEITCASGGGIARLERCTSACKELCLSTIRRTLLGMERIDECNWTLYPS